MNNNVVKLTTLGVALLITGCDLTLVGALMKRLPYCNSVEQYKRIYSQEYINKTNFFLRDNCRLTKSQEIKLNSQKLELNNSGYFVKNDKQKLVKFPNEHGNSKLSSRPPK